MPLLNPEDIDAAAAQTLKGGVTVHYTPSYPPGCKHEWAYSQDSDGEQPSHCTKCGMSFTRYIFTECP